MMKRSHGDGGSYIKPLLRDTKNAALEGGALFQMTIIRHSSLILAPAKTMRQERAGGKAGS